MKNSIIILCLGLLFICSTVFSIINIPNQNILNNVFVFNINLQKKDVEQAKQVLDNYLEEIKDEEIELIIDDYKTECKLEDVFLDYNTENACKNSYAFGRGSNIFYNNFNIIKSYFFKTHIKCDYSINTEILDDIIDTLNENIEDKFVNNSYCIDGENLVIEKGKQGYVVDKDKLINEIYSKIGTEELKVNVPKKEKILEPIDIEEIHNEVYKEKKDAQIVGSKIVKEETGIDFNIDEAKGQLNNTDKNRFIIKLKINKPEKTIKSLGEEMFKNEITRFSTKYDAKNTNRATNIQIAASKINNTIINPGEIFSFNKIVGNRSENGGYKEAPIYKGGKVVQGIGGGICQVSTTLYNCALYANLEIVERKNHIFAPHYVDPGLDATVAWGAVDFKFKNNRSNAIKISCVAKDGALVVKFFGIKEFLPEVVLKTEVIREIDYEKTVEEDETLPDGTAKLKQAGQNGCEVITKKITKIGNDILKDEVISKDLYQAIPEIYLVPVKED